MDAFLKSWGNAVHTSFGFFWMALWAFALGYLISSLIQVLVTRQRMKDTMGESGPRSVALATFFGFISSSCSFAALSTTRALLKKGAGLVPALAFMLASTNLVVELGIVIAIFLSWQFVVGEYLGGLLLIGFVWILVRLTKPEKLLDKVRDQVQDEDGNGVESDGNWKEKISSFDGWKQIGMKYVMEWKMVWKDVLIGFTVAGVISAFVPDSFFEALFLGSGGENSQNPGFFPVLAQTLIGPIAAFFTFIGSMGNIPLAALLFDRGVSFAGVMAFIFSDLVVLPVLRINAKYYGWKMAFYILGLLLAALVATSLLMHYGFLTLGFLPETGSGRTISDRQMFKVDYTFVLNILFLLGSCVLGWLWWRKRSEMEHEDRQDFSVPLPKLILRGVSVLAVIWLAGGLLVKAFGIGA